MPYLPKASPRLTSNSFWTSSCKALFYYYRELHYLRATRGDLYCSPRALVSHHATAAPLRCRRPILKVGRVELQGTQLFYWVNVATYRCLFPSLRTNLWSFLLANTLWVAINLIKILKVFATAVSRHSS